MNRRLAIKAEPRAAAQPSEEGLSVGQLLGRARASLLSRLDAELERFGLTGMQFAVLKQLAEGAAHTAADLCRSMQYDTGAMTRIVDRLDQCFARHPDALVILERGNRYAMRCESDVPRRNVFVHRVHQRAVEIEDERRIRHVTLCTRKPIRFLWA